jgi:hypothetical protein
MNQQAEIMYWADISLASSTIALLKNFMMKCCTIKSDGEIDKCIS